MNKVILIGRLTKDPDVRATNDGKMVGKYTLAVNRPGDAADFIPCVAFGKAAEFAEKYLHKGIKIAITGRIQTGAYKDKEGKTVYSTNVVIDTQEFCESKGAAPSTDADGFMNIPDNVDDEGLPFA